MKVFSFLLIMTIASAHASGDEASSLKIRVQYGEKSSRFDTIRVKGKAQLKLTTNEGFEKSRVLTPRDEAYLLGSLKRLSAPKSQKCPRDEVNISFLSDGKTVRIESCLLGKDPKSKEIRGLVTSLASWIHS